MRASAIDTTPAEKAPVKVVPSRLINPVTGYGLAAVVSAAFWAVLLTAIF
ncbi:hypothetical protein [Brevundimonas sp.]|jgi:trans-2-enoyl-CoA reductase|nr:hypothetical protein [Brevundimonas sp.]MBA4808822.1 hypothetical protein [Brevundimonas sp.]